MYYQRLYKMCYQSNRFLPDTNYNIESKQITLQYTSISEYQVKPTQIWYSGYYWS